MHRHPHWGICLPRDHSIWTGDNTARTHWNRSCYPAIGGYFRGCILGRFLSNQRAVLFLLHRHKTLQNTPGASTPRKWIRFLIVPDYQKAVCLFQSNHFPRKVSWNCFIYFSLLSSYMGITITLKGCFNSYMNLSFSLDTWFRKASLQPLKEGQLSIAT